VNAQEIDAVLSPTLADHKLAGGERTVLLGWLAQQKPKPQECDLLRSRAFSLAKARVTDATATQVIDWLEATLRVIEGAERGAFAPAATGGGATKSDAFFSPGDACVVQIASLFQAAKKAADVCVFTITDDRISRAIDAAHRRGVKLRILTDNEKMFDPGSDIERFKHDGIAVKVDATTFHMHHKFAIFDGAKLLTGSYNWTRGAAENNEENFIVTNEPVLIQEFAGEFEKLWNKLENA